MDSIDTASVPAQNESSRSLPNGETKRAKELKAAAESFESFFISMLLKEMQKSSGGKSLFGKGTSGEVYGELFNRALADQMAAQNGIGLSKMMLDSLREPVTPLKGTDSSAPLGGNVAIDLVR
jgi:flagellar protein FlgJ